AKIGMLTKCSGAVLENCGSLRASSAHTDTQASLSSSDVFRAHFSRSSGSACRSWIMAALVLAVRCFAAMRATTWWPSRPHALARTGGRPVKQSAAINQAADFFADRVFIVGSSFGDVLLLHPPRDHPANKLQICAHVVFDRTGRAVTFELRPFVEADVSKRV